MVHGALSQWHLFIIIIILLLSKQFISFKNESSFKILKHVVVCIINALKIIKNSLTF